MRSSSSTMIVRRRLVGASGEEAGGSDGGVRKEEAGEDEEGRFRTAEDGGCVALTGRGAEEGADACDEASPFFGTPKNEASVD